MADQHVADHMGEYGQHEKFLGSGLFCCNSATVSNKISLAPQIVAYDFGIKHNILRRLASFGCRLTVVPADYPASKVLEMNPDGVFLSNGPVSPPQP